MFLLFLWRDGGLLFDLDLAVRYFGVIRGAVF
jgi:hypothetical protein